MDTNQMREEFETQFVEEYVRVLGEGARELAAHALAANSPVVSMSWWAWQASRAAAVVELPALAEPFEAELTTAPIYTLKGDGRNEAIAECRAAIEAQGLKVKP